MSRNPATARTEPRPPREAASGVAGALRWVAASAGVAVVGGAVWQLRPPPPEPQPEASQAPDPEAELPPVLRYRPPPRKKPEYRVEPEFAAPGPGAGDEFIDSDEARVGFANALAELDQLLLDDRKLSRREYDRAHRDSSTAFAVYTQGLDATDPEQRTRIEAARRQLLERLGTLEARVRQKPGR